MGEMFLNSPLHSELRPFSGVEIMHIKSSPDKEVWDQDRTIVWERWDNNFMVLTESPYLFLQLLIHVRFIAYRYRKDALKTFQWSQVKLNLTGDES